MHAEALNTYIPLIGLALSFGLDNLDSTAFTGGARLRIFNGLSLAKALAGALLGSAYIRMFKY